MATKIIDEKVGTTIWACGMECKYHHTEVEDKNEQWDNHWLLKNGEAVIHRGNEHDVYIADVVK